MHPAKHQQQIKCFLFLTLTSYHKLLLQNLHHSYDEKALLQCQAQLLARIGSFAFLTKLTSDIFCTRHCSWIWRRNHSTRHPINVGGCPGGQGAPSCEVAAPGTALRTAFKNNSEWIFSHQRLPWKPILTACAVAFKRGEKDERPPQHYAQCDTGESHVGHRTSKEQEIGITVYFCILVLFWPKAAVRTC